VTINVITAAVKNGVKKIVITSSIAAMEPGNEGELLNENTWADETKCPPYSKSKLKAEKAAWELWEKSGRKFDLVSINPCLVLGPEFQVTKGGSEEFIVKCMTKGFTAIPETQIGIVDVRDMAFAHVRALQTPAANGKRYLLISKALWIEEFDALRAEFEPKATSFRLTRWASSCSKSLEYLMPKLRIK